ncbi:DUF4013 domain-containing protein [Natronomonas sp. CBA1123]|uniref:DUF4013 domain-containing protein n=1 Tax=Natronomonas sp. CBA1123 TaxID=2668070 RepID=UPI0012E9FA2E|nr:DUF4013 domain-containing protein [Natronomonas sp. CBA1123]MUV87069.1 DUF4013 domain-containing protein [Natronomonas sp. CBA1123]
MIEGAFNYPRESDDVVKTVVIGGLCLLFAWLLVPGFLALGYILRVIDRTSEGDDEPPVFDDYEAMIIDGAKAFVILFAYSLLPAIVAFLAIGIGFLGIAGGENTAALGGLALAAGLLVAFALNLVVAYVTPAALANYTETRRIGSGFEFGTLRGVLFDRRYAVGWLTALVMVLIGGVIAGVLNVVPVLGSIVGVFVSFYFVVSAYYVIGHTWSDVRSSDPPEPDTVGGGTEA